MGEAFIPRKINFNTSISSFAIIAVTYPSGSSCTCTNGTIILNDSNTNGQAVFAVPEAGTWTVSCSNGTNSKSEVVNITAKGQFETIELAYSFTLFASGSGVTNGYTTDAIAAGNGTEVTNSKITIADSNTQREIVYFTPAIDCSKYSKITFVGKQTSGGSAASAIYLGVTNAIPANGDNLPTYTASTTFNEDKFNVEHTVELDISSINVSCYVVICGFYMSSGEVTSIIFS